MNPLPTLILSPRYTIDSIALAQAASELGWPMERLIRWSAPQHLRGADVTLYGEPFFVSAIAEQLSLSLFEPPFNWLALLPSSYLKRAIKFGILEDAKRVMKRSFIKPADDKSFTAQIYETGDALPPTDHLPAKTPILISEPVEWEIEYRGFILNRQLQTLSPYFRSGSLVQTGTGEWPAPPAEIEEAKAYYANLLSNTEVELPPAVVIDIGKIQGQGWAVVEANPAWSSGIYGCDPTQVLKVIAKSMSRDQCTIAANRKWVIVRTE